MKTTSQIAKHIRELHTGGNWTWSNLRDQLSDITWQQSITQVESLNTIATLAFHINYFVKVQINFLESGTIEGSDTESFEHPTISCQEDWDKLLSGILQDGETLAVMVEKLDDSLLEVSFGEEKYGTYYRNLAGMVEHAHYHLGQIALIKKILS